MGSPSPLSTSVLVIIDVGECQQQCYFFSRVQHCNVSEPTSSTCDASESQNDAWAWDGDIEAPTALLTELHRRFPDVPLAASARELLASAIRPTSLSAGGRAKPSSLQPPQRGLKKRRRTLSASNFYGQQHPAMLLATPATQTSMEADNVAWNAFYEKLQFRVSHSQLCQLQGTAAVASVFPRQQEAFEFADQIARFRQRLRAHASTVGISGEADTVDAIDAMSPRVFSFEDAREGTRRFLVSSFASFWDTYEHRTQPTQRHVYEIIRERVPCRLYFDLGE